MMAKVIQLTDGTLRPRRRQFLCVCPLCADTSVSLCVPQITPKSPEGLTDYLTMSQMKTQGKPPGKSYKPKAEREDPVESRSPVAIPHKS